MARSCETRHGLCAPSRLISPAKQYAARLLHAGAIGYVQKESAAAELISAIHAAAQGHKYVDLAVANILLDDLHCDRDQPLHSSLLEREFKIFCKLAAGQRMTHIDSELSLSFKTVSTYRARIMQRMQMSRNAELTYYRLNHELIN